MKRMNTTTKKKIASIVAVILVITLLLSSILPFFIMTVRGAEVKKDFTVEAVIGFNGASKAFSGIAYCGEPNPLEIKVKNNSGKAFEGYLEIPVKHDNYNCYGRIGSYSYYIGLTLENNQEKTFNYSVPIYNYIEENNYININILNKYKKPVQSDTFLFQDVNLPLIGVLSHSKGYTRLLSCFNIINSSGNMYAVDISCDNLEQPIYMSKIGLIVMDDVGVASLSQTQKQELCKWISGGGLLLLDGEQNKALLKEIFDKAQKENSLNSNNIQFGYDNYNDNTNTELGLYTLDKGGVFIPNISLSDDKRTENSREISDFANIALNYVNDYNISYTYTDLYDFYYNEGDVIEENPIVPRVIMVMLFVYAIGIGPVLYFVLKKINKKDLIIKILPVTSVVLTAIIYLLSQGSDYNKGIINGYAVISADNNQAQTKNVASEYMISYPNKKNIKIKIDDNSEILNVKNNDGIVKGKSDTNIYLDEGIIGFDNNGVWERKYVNLKTPVELAGDLENNLVYNSPNKQVEGSVTNNTGYTLNNCFVGVMTSYSKGNVYYIDTINNGETVNISSLNSNAYTDINTLFSNDKGISLFRRSLIKDYIHYISPGYSENEICCFALGFADDINNPVSAINSKGINKMNYMLQSHKTEKKYTYGIDENN